MFINLFFFACFTFLFITQIRQCVFKYKIYGFVKVNKCHASYKLKVWKYLSARLYIICRKHNGFKNRHNRLSCRVVSDCRTYLIIVYSVFFFYIICTEFCMEQISVSFLRITTFYTIFFTFFDKLIISHVFCTVMQQPCHCRVINI